MEKLQQDQPRVSLTCSDARDAQVPPVLSQIPFQSKTPVCDLEFERELFQGKQYYLSAFTNAK